MHKPNPFTLCILLLATAGCVSYTKYEADLRPISPKPYGAQFYNAVPVQSRQPAFRWQSSTPGRGVDLAIWRAAYIGKGPQDHTGFYERGAMVYLKENITTNEHLIQTNLAPDTIYFWSVKYSGTMEWSTATHTVISSTGFGRQSETARGQFFAIRTPK